MSFSYPRRACKPPNNTPSNFGSNNASGRFSAVSRTKVEEACVNSPSNICTALVSAPPKYWEQRPTRSLAGCRKAMPIQAALASAGSFAVGAVMPLAVTAIAPEADLIPLVSGTSLLFLALLGGLAARAGGAGVTLGAMRVTFWGALTMALTAGVGALFGTATTGT
jgi:VIT1/CCC1 family predicted Fe2+/Mn2+ transporter